MTRLVFQDEFISVLRHTEVCLEDQSILALVVEDDLLDVLSRKALHLRGVIHVEDVAGIGLFIPALVFTHPGLDVLSEGEVAEGV